MGLIKRVIVITNKVEELTSLVSEINIPFCIVRNREELFSLFYTKADCLLSYSTNVIVPLSIIEVVSLAINIHSASPDFPGRDPHHWAIYRRVKEYGATLHIMAAKVDSGPIIKSMMFSVNEFDTPMTLLSKANHKAIELAKWVLNELMTGNEISINGEKWGKNKTTRADLIRMFDLTNVDEEEFNIRVKSFSSPGYKNLFITKYGLNFYLD